MSYPVDCTLTDVEMRERRRTLLDLIQSAIIDTTERPSGYLYRFDTNDESVSDLTGLSRWKVNVARS
jgi:hypothetical protein